MKMLRALPSSESTMDQGIRNAVREVECLIHLGDKKGLEELYCDFTSMVSVVELVIKESIILGLSERGLCTDFTQRVMRWTYD